MTGVRPRGSLQLLLRFFHAIAIEVGVTPESDELAVVFARFRLIAALLGQLAEKIEATHVLDRPPRLFRCRGDDLLEPLGRVAVVS